MRDRLTSSVADLDARCHELALALLDLATARGELAQHLRGELFDLGHPVAHRAPAHPRQPLTDSGAQVGLVEESGCFGVLVDRGAIKRRPPPVSTAGHVRRHHMRVQLGILRAAHAMAIGGRHEPFPDLVAHTSATATYTTRLTLQIPQRRVNR